MVSCDRQKDLHVLSYRDCGQTEWLDGKHVVFGSVTAGMDVVRAVEGVGSESGRTSAAVVVADCGQLA